MEMVIVTVKSNECCHTFDIEVPTDLGAKLLADEIITLITSLDIAFVDSESDYEIYIENLKRTLAEDETLANAGAWDGSILSLIKQSTIGNAHCTKEN